MGNRGRLYSPGFKEEAIWLVHSCEEKYLVAKTTRDLDVSTEPLRKWVNHAQMPPESMMGSPPKRKRNCVASAKR